jgi:predicted TIM-barrel enzyme
MGADCVIVTGNVTGEAPKAQDVRESKSHCRLPVFLGSGISADNIDEFIEEADGFIIGSHFKVDGHWAGMVDQKRVERFMARVRIKDFGG